MLKMKIIVLALNKWDFVDEKTGEKREGVTVWYLTPSMVDSERGFVPSKNIIDFKSCPKPLDFPFLADAVMEIKTDSKNKNSIALSTFVPIKKIVLES